MTLVPRPALNPLSHTSQGPYQDTDITNNPESSFRSSSTQSLPPDTQLLLSSVDLPVLELSVNRTTQQVCTYGGLLPRGVELRCMHTADSGSGLSLSVMSTLHCTKHRTGLPTLPFTDTQTVSRVEPQGVMCSAHLCASWHAFKSKRQHCYTSVYCHRVG